MSDLAIIRFDANTSIEQAKQINEIVIRMRQDVLKENLDFGVIPGTNKPTLYKAGAEKLCSAFGLSPEFIPATQIEDFDKPLFFYRYTCQLRHIETGKILATGLGSCNSMEGKYGFRWVADHEVPEHLDKSTLLSKSSSVSEFQFAIDKAETTGKYGKPADYWQMFNDAIANGTAEKTQRKTRSGLSPAWIINAKTYRVPNEDIFSIVNTIDKMAQKRALIAAVLIGVNASEFFTQDVEDLPEFEQKVEVVPPTSKIIDAEFEEIAPVITPPQQNNQPAQQATKNPFSDKAKSSNQYKEANRRVKVLAGTTHFTDMNELMPWANANGVNWDNSSAEIIEYINGLKQAS